MSKNKKQVINDKPTEVESSEKSIDSKPLSYRSYQELFIVFFVFSIIGHYMEVVWAWIKYFAIGSRWFPTVVDIIPMAIPYGLGAVALLLTIWPLMKKRKLNPLIVFVLSAIVTGATEFMCALFLVIIYGKNYFWDYSNNAFNLFGFVCLQGVVLFGISSVIFLYFIYPKFEKFFDKFKRQQITKFFWILFILYFVNLTLVCIREFWK